jgi:hypothetical protein
MTIEEANKLLDAVKDGKFAQQKFINEALFTTGDLQEITPTFDLDGWLERRKTICLARSKTA